MSATTNSRQQLCSAIQDLMHANRRQADDALYTVPSPDTYPYQWLWDSCYHAIILRHFDVDSAKRELQSLFLRQYDNGMLPHMLYWQPSEKININWGKDGVSSITQPPIVALAVQKVLETDADINFLSSVYPGLQQFYDYLLRERVDDSGLAAIINPDESGEDNSPRFDQALGLNSGQSLSENFAARLELVDYDRGGEFDLDRMRQRFWVYDVPFNCFLVENLQIMSELATQQGLSDDARRYTVAADKLETALKQQLFDGEEYWPIDGANGRELHCLSWHVFAPLACGLLSETEARRLIHSRLLSDQTFLTTYGVRTVAKHDPAYDPEGMWRGPVWTSVNWWVARGLQRYGYVELAHSMGVASLQLLKRSGFREYYHPETGAGLGAHDFTWGGLVLDMLEFES